MLSATAAAASAPATATAAPADDFKTEEVVDEEAVSWAVEDLEWNSISESTVKGKII